MKFLVVILSFFFLSLTTHAYDLKAGDRVTYRFKAIRHVAKVSGIKFKNNFEVYGLASAMVLPMDSSDYVTLEDSDVLVLLPHACEGVALAAVASERLTLSVTGIVKRTDGSGVSFNTDAHIMCVVGPESSK